MENSGNIILLIDDNSAQLTLLENMLKNDYEVYTAHSGKAALDYLQSGLHPKLILLDILMPEMDGWEIFGRIRAISFLHEVPIAFLTSVNETKGKTQADTIGAADYITKPCTKNELLKRVKTILEKNTNANTLH